MSLFQNNQHVQIGGGGLFGVQSQNPTQQGTIFGQNQQQHQQQRPDGLFQNKLSVQTGSAFGQQQPMGGFQGVLQAPGGDSFNNGFQQHRIQHQQQQQQQQLQQQQSLQHQVNQPLLQQQLLHQQNQPLLQQQQQQQQQQHNQAGPAKVNSQVWLEMKDVYQKLQNVRKDHISVEKDINVSDNNNKYAHKPVTSLPKELIDGLTFLNIQIADSDKQVAKMVEEQKELFNSIQETRKTIQQASLGLKQTAQQVKDIQQTVIELIAEQQEQKQYITNFFYTFTNYLENKQFPKILLPQPFVVKTQEKFQLKIEKIHRQIEEVEEMLKVEITKRNKEEELAFMFVIVEQLFKYFNNVTALIYEFHKHYEDFRMKIVQIQDAREFGFANDLNETTKRSLTEENRYFKQLSVISENLEKQIRKHEEETQGKVLLDKRFPVVY